MELRNIETKLDMKILFLLISFYFILSHFIKCVLTLFHMSFKNISSNKKHLFLLFILGFCTINFGYSQCTTCNNNLVVNGGLDTNVSGWTAYNGNFSSANYYPQCNTARHGMMQRTSGTATVYQDITGISVGSTLQFSFWSGVHDPSYDARFGLEFHNSNTPTAGTLISESKVQVDKILTGNPKMQYYSFSLVVPAGTVKIRIIGTATGDWIKFDEVCLQTVTPVNQCASLNPHSTCTPPSTWDKDVVATGNVDWQTLTGVAADNVTGKIRISGTGTVTINNSNLKLNSASAVVYLNGPTLIVNNGNIQIVTSGARYIQTGGSLFTYGNFEQSTNTSVCITNAVVNIGEEQSGRNFVNTASSTSANMQNNGGYRFLENSCINITHDFQLLSTGNGSGTNGLDVIKGCYIEVGDQGSNNAFGSAIGSADASDSGNWTSSNNQYIFDTKIILANGNFQTNSKPHLFCNVGIKINKSGNFQASSGSVLGNGLAVAANDGILNSATWTLTGFTWYSKTTNSTNVPNAGQEATLDNILATFFSTFCPFPQDESDERIGTCLDNAVEVISAGSYIIDMGVSPQTIGNGLKPYGMLYDLIKNYQVEVVWVINPNKVKDGVDFRYNGMDLRGGPFIIPSEYRSAPVNARISYWQSQGVVGLTTTSVINICEDFISRKLGNVPRWTLDKQNGLLAVPYFENAGIPSSAHGGSSQSGWKLPAELDCCDDLFVLPHADPIWSTHQRLYTWNQECRGGIWVACTAGSSLENMVNPSNRSQQSNFLTQKDASFTGSSGSYANSNSLIMFGDHSNGSPPYTHRLPADPVSQYLGLTDGALLNGSEQIYIPRQTNGTSARWNPSARIIAYDPSHTNVPSPNPDLRNAPAVMVYGRGFEDINRGYVMITAAHSLSRSSNPENIAAQRSFFNFSWLVAQDKAENLSIQSGLGDIAYSGNGSAYTFQLPGNSSNYNINWNSTCGGTFSQNGSQTVVFTPPTSNGIEGCIITVSITDDCGRTTSTSLRTAVICDFAALPTQTSVSCAGGNDGKINFTVSGESAVGASTWNWHKDGSGTTGSGSGLEIAGLSAGSYNVTVTSSSGCSATFNAAVIEPLNLVISPDVRNYTCYGASGGININVTGGNPPYSYAWNGGAATRNRDVIPAGTYTLTVTDSKGCTKSSVSVVTGPNVPFTASNTKADITCYGLTNGSANVTTSGGQSPYSYLWNGGVTTQNRSGLSAGSYAVTVTDVNGCSATSLLTISQPALLTTQLQSVSPSCPPGSTSPLDANGSITLTVNGGTPPYTYLWNSGATTQNRTNLSAGTYTVTVTDAQGCQISKSATLTNLSSLPATPTVIIR